MANIRKFHTYMGCFFAPLLLYFALSGAWQIYRLNDIPKDAPATQSQKLLHEISKPHKGSTLPGLDPKTASSDLAKALSLAMALGFTATIILGIQMGLQMQRRRKIVLACLVAGVLVPVLVLFIHR